MGGKRFCLASRAALMEQVTFARGRGKLPFPRICSSGRTDRGCMITRLKKNMKNKLMLRKRAVIESVNNLPKNKRQVEHARHRSAVNFLVNLLAGGCGLWLSFPQALKISPQSLMACFCRLAVKLAFSISPRPARSLALLPPVELLV